MLRPAHARDTRGGHLQPWPCCGGFSGGCFGGEPLAAVPFQHQVLSPVPVSRLLWSHRGRSSQIPPGLYPRALLSAHKMEPERLLPPRDSSRREFCKNLNPPSFKNPFSPEKATAGNRRAALLEAPIHPGALQAPCQARCYAGGSAEPGPGRGGAGGRRRGEAGPGRGGRGTPPAAPSGRGARLERPRPRFRSRCWPRPPWTCTSWSTGCGC